MQKAKKTILVLGGDGYLGWSLGLALAHRTNYNVVLVDNLIKRTWEKEVGSKPLVPYPKPTVRIAEYERIYGKKNLSFKNVELLDQNAVVELLKKTQPFAILNAAQQPSAPFSMMNAKNAASTFTNNIVGHLNVLWAIAEVDKSITYIKLGSGGCYSEINTDFLPLGKVDLEFKHDGKIKKILNSWLPMNANDFYHQSKIADFLIGDIASSVWKLRTVTIQQATIFGSTIEENSSVEHHGLSTRFNYDDIFGTVINRFVCQIAIDHPMTIYGSGDQRTGLISLQDTVDNILAMVEVDVKAGDHVIAHNYAERLSIKEIAETLKQVSGSAKVAYIENPRKESSGGLSREVERHEALRDPRKISEGLRSLLDFTKRYKDNIDRLIIMPKVKWELKPTSAPTLKLPQLSPNPSFPNAKPKTREQSPALKQGRRTSPKKRKRADVAHY